MKGSLPGRILSLSLLFSSFRKGGLPSSNPELKVHIRQPGRCTHGYTPTRGVTLLGMVGGRYTYKQGTGRHIEGYIHHLGYQEA